MEIPESHIIQKQSRSIRIKRRFRSSIYLKMKSVRVFLWLENVSYIYLELISFNLNFVRTTILIWSWSSGLSGSCKWKISAQIKVDSGASYGHFNLFWTCLISIVFYEILHQLVITQFWFIDFLQAWKMKLAVRLVFWRVWYFVSFPYKFFRRHMKFGSSNVWNQNWAQIIEFHLWVINNTCGTNDRIAVSRTVNDLHLEISKSYRIYHKCPLCLNSILDQRMAKLLSSTKSSSIQSAIWQS